MKKILITCTGLIFALLFISCQSSEKKKKFDLKTEKIISLNGALTEILVAFGMENQMVGRDVTSTYPTSVTDSIPDLGHVRSLTIEPIINLHPTLILGTEEELSKDLKNAIKNSEINHQFFTPKPSVKGTYELIDNLGKQFDQTAKAKQLKAEIQKNLEKLEKFEGAPKVLFIYARGAGTLMVSGKDTPIAEMIEISGGKNAIDEFSDYKPLTEEALLKENPDVILLFDSGLESLGGKKGLLKAVPALSQTKAGENAAILTMDGGLLSAFGPRLGEAAQHLNQLLVPYAK